MIRRIFMLSVILACTAYCSALATSKQEADEAYQKNDFETAIRLYEELVSAEGESAAVYYNLGNCYYKTGGIAKAILNYERALLLAPGDADTRFNLEMAKSKAVDKIIPTPEVFIVTWARSVVDSMSESSWSVLGIVCFILVLAGAVMYIFGTSVWMKKVGFIAGIVLVIICILANLAARDQKSEIVRRNACIVLSPSVTVKSTPDNSGTDLFVIHEGTKVFIDDDTMSEWKEVRLEDGKKGWMPASAIEAI